LRALPGHRGKVTKLVVSPDGKHLVSASQDTTALVWDVAALRPQRSAKPTADTKVLASLWEDLGSTDPKLAYGAACRAVAAGDTAVAVIKSQLKPLVPVDETKVTGWLKQLDSADFGERERASESLAELGPAAEPVLRK